ncbi:carboxylesterase/lipase family protein [Variovorax sp. KK3]|uniref:carboxylesterase/lipase family protein n=1 Tax=Variovorax sp. KK3 TaxID=1855728 RepID=UPI00097C05D7|nr:carboxylesterase family protein [Variovorax sp. KK3]
MPADDANAHGPADGALVRRTSAGSLAGADDGAGAHTWSWKGVPFAKPPVGPLRWRAPMPPEPWSGVRQATAFGHACLQIGRLYGPGANNRYDATIASTLNTPVGSEDCLTLNVWRPASTEQGLPVLFFIHGGSNISGYTADPVYDGAHLARAANAVVVTANYRLGVLGFLDMPQLRTGAASGEDSGNFALLDILAALRWVKNDIEAFGGDAGNVTLMGQSAGAINLLALLVSPLAQGLFHKAVPLSGGISLASNLPAGSLPTLLPASAYQAQGKALLLHLLVADGTAADLPAAERHVAAQSDAQVGDYLRAQDARTILSTVLAKGLTGSGPIPDGTVVPQDPIAAIAAGRYARVPTLTGMTRDEGKLFAPFLTLLGGKPGIRIDDATRFTLMQGFDPDAPASLATADILDASYLPVGTPDTGYDARTDLLTQRFMAASRDNLLDTLKSQQPNLWHYQFDWSQEPPPWNEVYGAAHAFDLPFVFGNFGPSVFANAANSRANEPGRLALSAAMMAGIAAFLRNGDPNDTALGIPWPPWPARMVFDATPDAARIAAHTPAG